MKGSGKLLERRAAVLGLLAGCTGLGFATMLCQPAGAGWMERIRDCLPGSANLSDAETLHRFRAVVEADFQAGRIVRRDGWYLSATEAALLERLGV